MAVRTAAHLMHLSAPSYARHIALNEFYDGLLDLADEYAEVYMGLETQVKNWPAPTPVERTDPVALLEDFLELLKEEEAENSDSQSLLNALAGMEELTARTLYKLRNLK
jgi:hypothetical protein